MAAQTSPDVVPAPHPASSGAVNCVGPSGAHPRVLKLAPLSLLSLPDEVLCLIVRKLHGLGATFARQTLPFINRRFAALLKSDLGLFRRICIRFPSSTGPGALPATDFAPLTSWTSQRTQQISALTLTNVDENFFPHAVVLLALLHAQLTSLDLHLTSAGHQLLNHGPPATIPLRCGLLSEARVNVGHMGMPCALRSPHHIRLMV